MEIADRPSAFDVALNGSDSDDYQDANEGEPDAFKNAEAPVAD